MFNKNKLVLLATLFGMGLSTQLWAVGGISGEIWNDINVNQAKELGTNVLNPFGDSVLPDAGVEVGVVGVNVQLLDSGGTEVATTTSVAGGGYSFAAQADGDYTLVFTAPDRFDFSATTPSGDHFAVSDPAPNLGDPQLARLSVTVAGSDVSTGTSVGLRALTEFAIEVADLDPDPNVVQRAIESGKPSFDPFSDCAYNGTDSEEGSNFTANPPTPGSDCYHFDNWVRSNDLETYTFSLTATNHPDLNGNGLLDAEDEIQNAILEVILQPIDNGRGNSEVRFETNSITGVPVGCLGDSDGVTPASNITTDNGNVILICNLGAMDNSARIIPLSIMATGNSPHGSSYNIDARLLSASNEGIASSVFNGLETFVSAAPRFDLTKGPHPDHDPVTNPVPNPYNRIVQYAAFVTKDIGNGAELGKSIRWDFSLVAGTGDNRGLASLGEEITFKDFYHTYPNFTLQSCHPGPYYSSRLPHNGAGVLPFQDNKTANNGSWQCTQDNPGEPISVKIIGADTSGAHVPTKDHYGKDISSTPIVVTGSILVWVPLRDLYQSRNPAWQEGDEPEYGTYTFTNCSSDFDPDSKHAPGDSALGNYSTGFEPSYGEADGDPVATGNNCMATDVIITPDGSFKKYVGGGERGVADLGPSWPCTSSGLNLVPGQTACSSGDGPVSIGQTWFSSIGWYMQGRAGVTKKLKLCDVVDNAVYKPIPFADVPGRNPEPDEPAFVRTNPAGTPEILGADFYIEYAYFAPSSGRKTWHNTHNAGVADPITGYIPIIINDDMKNAAKDCGDALTAVGTLVWTDEPDTIPGGFDNIVLMKASINNASQQVSPNSNTYFGGLFEVRETIYGDANQPGVGEALKAGMLHSNLANWYHENGNTPTYGPGDYDPNTNAGELNPSYAATYGARLIHQAVDIRVTKGADVDATNAVVKADGMQQGFAGVDKIFWWMDPTVSDRTNRGIARNMVLTDTLPPYLSFNPSCTPEPPDGVTGPVVSAGPNAGETTLVWNLGDRPANVDIDPIVICTDSSAFAPAPVDVLNKVVVSADNVSTTEKARSASRAVRLLQLGQLALRKAVDQIIDPRNDEQVWTLTWANTSENLPFEPEDVIDVFPWNGDGLQAGNTLSTREGFASDFNGTLQLTAALPMPTKRLNGAERPANGLWYYTKAAANTVSHNPQAASNVLNGGSTKWCTEAEFGNATCPANFREVTAIRWRAEQDANSANFDPLRAGESVTVEMKLAAGTYGNDATQTQNEAGDFYVNRFGAYSGTIDNPVYSNEPYVLVTGFSLGDLLFLDVDQNGKYDSSVDKTAPKDVVIELVNSATNTTVRSTTTLDNGRYLFEKVPAGDYYVRVPAAEFANRLQGWRPANTPVLDPNADDANEMLDHHAIVDPDNAGAARSSGVLTLSTSVNAATGEITGDEPEDDNVAALGRALIPDTMTNFTLDLGLISDVDLELNKTVDKTEVAPGQTVNYTLTIRNTSNTDAADVVVNDKLPVRLEYVSDDSSGLYDASSGDWTVGKVPANSSRSLVITAKLLVE